MSAASGTQAGTHRRLVACTDCTVQDRQGGGDEGQHHVDIMMNQVPRTKEQTTQPQARLNTHPALHVKN